MGTEAFKKCIKNAISPIEYKIMNIRKNFDLTNVDQKISFVNETAVILSNVDNTIEREAYIKRISNETDISEKSITSEINKLIF